jgi:exodeoxyribonuclease VII small subunit
MSNDLGETSSGTKKLSEQIDELTAIVKKLEDPTIELEDALAVYEAGMKIAKATQAALEDAEQRIETVSAAHSDS